MLTTTVLSCLLSLNRASTGSFVEEYLSGRPVATIMLEQETFEQATRLLEARPELFRAAGRLTRVSSTLDSTFHLPVGLLIGVRVEHGGVTSNRQSRTDPELIAVIVSPQSLSLAELYRYDQEREEVLLAALDWPKVVFDGIVARQMEMVSRSRGRGIASLPDVPPDLMSLEETELNRLEARVWSAGTGGEYSRAVDRLLKTLGDGPTVPEALAHLSAPRLRVLDRIIGCGECPRELAQHVLRVHLSELGGRLTDRQP